MLQSFRLQLQGKDAARLQEAVAGRAEELLDRLLVDGVELWRQEQFRRWDDGEIACSVRLYDCCRRVLESDRRTWSLVHVEYDGAHPTTEILSGDADPTRSPRPDFGFRFGTARVVVEAKRLSTRDGLPKLYVKRGIYRFRDGRYLSTNSLPGIMVGYIRAEPPAAVVGAVNQVIIDDPDMGNEEVLRELVSVAPDMSRSQSVHPPGIRLIHLAVDVGGKARVQA